MPHILPLARRPDVIPILAGWLFEEWGDYHEHDSVDCRIAELTERLADERLPLTFAAFESDAPDAAVIGTAALTADDMDTRLDLTPWLASVLVTPTARGRGVGSALVRAVVVEAAAQGFERLYLFTEGQQALYARLGWGALEDCDYHGYHVTIMSLEPAAALRASGQAADVATRRGGGVDAR